jgi:hypothetical protein
MGGLWSVDGHARRALCGRQIGRTVETRWALDALGGLLEQLGGAKKREKFPKTGGAGASAACVQVLRRTGLYYAVHLECRDQQEARPWSELIGVR